MNHKEALELLERYADGRLDASERSRIEEHIVGCLRCQSLLDGITPVSLAAFRTAGDRTLRRSVRRTLWRGVLGGAALLVVVFAGLALISNFVVQPLLMDRGGRADAVARATYDVATMFNEGAVVSGFAIDSGAFNRTFTAKVQLPVGSGMADLGTVSSQIGLLNSSSIWPFVDSDSTFMGAAPEVLGRFDSGTVATVAARFPEPISVAQAQSVADSTDADISVIWAGFLLTGASNITPKDPVATLGYSTCLRTDQFNPRLFAASSAEAGASFGSAYSSVANALRELRRSLANLAENPEVAAQLFDGGAQAVQHAAAYLADNDPQVESLVVTGPTSELLRFLDEVDAKDGTVLAVDFYNWSGSVCAG